MVDTVKNKPFIPVISRIKGHIQPVYIGDLVKLVQESINHEELQRHTIEVGGPEVVTPTQIMETIADILGIEKKTKTIPFFWVHLGLSILQKFTSKLPMSIEQLNMMRDENIVRFPNMENYFQIQLTPLKEGLSYLKKSTNSSKKWLIDITSN